MSDDEEEDPDMAKRPTVTIRINAHVNGEDGEKVIPIPCGTGPQTIKWLGHVVSCYISFFVEFYTQAMEHLLTFFRFISLYLYY